MSTTNGNTGHPARREILHRLREARIRIGYSLDEMAAKLNKTPAEVLLDEDPVSDICVSTLRSWSQVLDVPIRELLVDNSNPMDLRGLTIDRLRRMEATAKQIAGLARNTATETFAVGLARQLREFLPDDAPDPPSGLDPPPLTSGHVAPTTIK